MLDQRSDQQKRDPDRLPDQPAAHVRGASARSVGGTGAAGPGSDVNEDDDAGK
jgi:hypothetical protein